MDVIVLFCGILFKHDQRNKATDLLSLYNNLLVSLCSFSVPNPFRLTKTKMSWPEHPLHNSRMLQLASRPCLGALWLTLASDPEEGLSPWPSNPSCWHRGGSASVCWLLGKRNRCVRPHGYKLAERPGVKPRYGLHFEALSTTWATPPQRIQETDLHCVT